MTTAAEFLADLGAAADELGYGVVRVGVREIELVSRQDHIRLRFEGPVVSGDILRRYLVPIPHRSGWPMTTEFERERIG